MYQFCLNPLCTEPEEVFKMLRGLTSGTPAGQPFLSILQHLLLVRDDFFARPQYFKLVDKCVSQIVLHKGGLDPDFHYTRKFTIDVDGIVGKFFAINRPSNFMASCLNCPIHSKTFSWFFPFYFLPVCVLRFFAHYAQCCFNTTRAFFLVKYFVC